MPSGIEEMYHGHSRYGNTIGLYFPIWEMFESRGAALARFWCAVIIGQKW